MRRLAATTIACCCAALSAVVPARATSGAAQQPTFATKGVGVLVDVLATDRGKPVSGLTSADFELRDNGVVQKIDAALSSEDAAVNVILALDVSASVAGQRLVDLSRATQALIDGLRYQDRAGLVTFSDAVSPRLPFTSDFTRITSMVAGLVPSGNTAILDGIYVSLMETQAEPGRSLVVVCTDGRDTASWLQADEVIESARRSNAVVYTVATGGARSGFDLKDIADATGGQSLVLTSSTDLAAQFERILREFRSRYLLSFTPQGVAVGGFHRLEVRARKSGLAIKARTGYIDGPFE